MIPKISEIGTLSQTRPAVSWDLRHEYFRGIGSPGSPKFNQFWDYKFVLAIRSENFLEAEECSPCDKAGGENKVMS